MAELIISQRPDVVLWTLKAFYPENTAFQNIAKGTELATAIQNGTAQLPVDYRQKVDILVQFDEFEAVGDPNQPTRKQTPLIPIVAEVAKAVRELAPQVVSPAQKKDAAAPPVFLPEAPLGTPARDVLDTILNSGLLSPEQRAASRKAYEEVVQRAMGKVPVEAHKPKELPGETTPIKLSDESRKDTVTHAENPNYGRNRQFGLISLTDSYFGGALGLFNEALHTITERQLKALSYRHLHDRAAGIISLADNNAQTEGGGGSLRERLRKVLTSDCIFGCAYKDKGSYYSSRSTYQKMISDLPSISSGESSFMKGEQRGLYIDLPGLRGQVEEVRKVIQSLKQKDGDYFDTLDKQLSTFIDGQFLKDADTFQTKIGEDYARRFKDQVMSPLFGNSPDKTALFSGVEALQRNLNSAIKNAPGGYYSSEAKNKYLKQIGDALQDPSKTFEDPKMQEDLVRAREVMNGVSPTYEGTAWKNSSLISPEKSDKNSSLGDDILKSAAKNKAEFDSLGNVLQSMALVYDLAELYAAIPDDRRPTTPLWEPQSQGIALKGATNPYAVLRMVMAGGKPMSDFSESDEWTNPASLRGTNWPPRDQERVERDFKRHAVDLRKAFEAITPVDIEVSPQRPIALIVGNNGSGKTFAMETAVQSIGFAQRTGIQPFTREQKTVYTPTVRAMINASRHKELVSSFQGEVDLMKDVIDDVKSRDKNSCAVWAIDEIGKGTDSRDALALLFGTIEWARRNNVHFVVSTHYGKQFMELAQMLGLNDSIQIYNPNPETHELMPNTEITASHGVEVMEKMGRKNSIPLKLLDALAENARKIRAIHDSRERAILSKIETSSSVKSFRFTHDEDLADIGLSATKRDYGDSEGNFAMRGLSENQFVISDNKPILGESMAYSYSSSSESPVRKVAVAVKESWKDQFERQFANTELSPEQIEARKGHIHEMVTLTVSDSEAQVAASHQLFTTAIGKRALETTIPADALKNINERIAAFYKKDDPFKEYVYIESDKGEPEFELFKRMADGSKIVQLQKASQDISSYLSQEGASQHLKQLGVRVGLVDKLGIFFNEKTQIPPTEVNAKYNRAIVHHILSSIQSTLVPYSSYSADEFKQYVPQMQELFELPTLTSGKEVFAYISEQVKSGDLTTLLKLNTWINSQVIPESYSYSSTPLSSLKSAFSFFSEMQTDMVKRLTSNAEALATARSIAEDPAASAESIAKKMYDAFATGDCVLLDKLLSIPNLDSKLSYQYSEDSLKQLGHITTTLEVERWMKWQDTLSQMNKIKIDASKDYYSVLQISPLATSDEIKAAITAMKTKGEAEPAELQTAEKILLSDERLAYDLALAEKAFSEAQFLMTVAGAIQKHSMCIPTHSEDGTLDVKNGINIHLADSLGSRYIPQSLHVDGDINTVVIGGMNGGGKSQTLITLADIAAWDHFIGYVPAEQATLPKADFIVSAINAGESIVGMSSFQNEITRYLKVLDRYVEAGCPKSGMVFLDEPLAGTSSEDQAGILVSIVDFLQSRGVKVIMTNHNHAFFDVIRRTDGSTGEPIKFLPVAFGSEGRKQFQLEYFDSDHTDQIKSRGIDVAEERGVDPSIIKVARNVRQLIDQIEAAKGKIQS